MFRLGDFVKPYDDCRFLETIVLYHGAPTIHGIKPANLVNIVNDERDLEKAWPVCKERLIQELQVEIQELRVSKNQILILLYRPELLSFRFLCQGAKNLLLTYGYPVKSGHVADWVARLTERFQEEACPHEVGIFLGYPPQDVCQFIRRNGACSKANGLWKIYGNIGRARRKLRKYQGATNVMGSLLHGGASLAEIRMNLSNKSQRLVSGH